MSKNQVLSDEQQEKLAESDQYANYIMANCGGDRCIANGDMLIKAMEDGYLWDEFINSIEG